MFLALQANGNKLLIQPIKLQEAPLIKHLPHILNPEHINQAMKILLLQNLQLHIHLTILTHIFNLLLPHPIHNILQVQILLSQVEPVDRHPLGCVVDPEVTIYAVWLLKEGLVLPGLTGVEFHGLDLLLVLDLFFLEVAFVFFVLVDELAVVLTEVLLVED